MKLTKEKFLKTFGVALDAPSRFGTGFACPVDYRVSVTEYLEKVKAMMQPIGHPQINNDVYHDRREFLWPCLYFAVDYSEGLIIVTTKEV